MKKFNIMVLIMCVLVSNSYAQAPTWNKNISCIIYSHCTNCHNENGLAPMSFTTYANVFNYRNSIVPAIEERKMPPHLPDPNYTHFVKENVLDANEIQLIKDWVTNGAPEGDATTALPEPVYQYTDEIINPDLVVRIPEFVVPNTGEDLYQAFVVSNPSPRAMYITSMEVVPGNRNIVHHVLVYQDTSNIVVTNDSSFAGPGYVSFGGVSSSTANLMDTWVPGCEVTKYPAGMGIKLEAGARIILQIHYPNGSEGKIDSTKVNFKLSNSSLRNVQIQPLIYKNTMTNGPLFIPANTVKTFHAQLQMPFDLTFIFAGPHGHLLCKSFECYGIKPSGDTIKLIKIDDWDFHWQGTHTFKSPVKMPRGTMLHCYATYDNTSNNPENPSNPPRDVRYGENTTDEMMFVFFGFLLYQQGDENIIADSSFHLKHYLDCDPGVQIDNGEPSKEIIVYPNPAHHYIKINIPRNTVFSTDIYNSTGQLVSKTSNQDYINIATLNSGIYFVKIKYNNTVVTKKILKY